MSNYIKINLDKFQKLDDWQTLNLALDEVLGHIRINGLLVNGIIAYGKDDDE